MSPALETGQAYGFNEDDTVWLQRLSHKRQCTLHLVLWRHLLLEPSRHAVRKPNQPCGELTKKNKGPWPEALAELPDDTRTYHWPHDESS